MSFEAELKLIVEAGVGAGLKAFASELDSSWVASAIDRGITATLRRRRLPAESVVWLVIGMALFRDHSIADVVKRLELVTADADGASGRVANAALPKARKRVGARPLEDLFAISASEWSHAQAALDGWRGLSVYAMDGTTLSVPDTDENRDAFTLHVTPRGQAGYPKVRVVTLMAARSHLIVDAAVGPFSGEGTGEQTLARQLWHGVPDNSLLIADRNFIDYAQLHRFATTGEERHWIFRM